MQIFGRTFWWPCLGLRKWCCNDWSIDRRSSIPAGVRYSHPIGIHQATSYIPEEHLANMQSQARNAHITRNMAQGPQLPMINRPGDEHGM